MYKNNEDLKFKEYLNLIRQLKNSKSITEAESDILRILIHKGFSEEEMNFLLPKIIKNSLCKYNRSNILMYNLEHFSKENFISYINFVCYHIQKDKYKKVQINKIYPFVQLDTKILQEYPYHGLIFRSDWENTNGIFKVKIYYINKDKIEYHEFNEYIYSYFDGLGAKYFLNDLGIRYDQRFAKKLDINKTLLENLKDYIVNENVLERIIIKRNNISYDKFSENIIIRGEICIPSVFIENNYKILKNNKQDIIKKFIDYVSLDNRFIKFGIPINYFKVSNISVSRTGLMHIIMDLNS